MVLFNSFIPKFLKPCEEGITMCKGIRATSQILLSCLFISFFVPIHLHAQTFYFGTLFPRGIYSLEVSSSGCSCESELLNMSDWAGSHTTFTPSASYLTYKNAPYTALYEINLSNGDGSVY